MSDTGNFDIAVAETGAAHVQQKELKPQIAIDEIAPLSLGLMAAQGSSKD